jgi:hypothetical protein
MKHTNSEQDWYEVPNDKPPNYQSTVAQIEGARCAPPPLVQRDAEEWEKMERKMAEMEKSLLAAWREINWLRRRV